MIGDEVTKYRAILELSYPTTEGIVKNWDDMDLLLGYSFKSVRNTHYVAGSGQHEGQISDDDRGSHEPSRKQGQDGGAPIREVPDWEVPAWSAGPDVALR